MPYRNRCTEIYLPTGARCMRQRGHETHEQFPLRFHAWRVNGVWVYEDSVTGERTTTAGKVR